MVPPSAASEAGMTWSRPTETHAPPLPRPALACAGPDGLAPIPADSCASRRRARGAYRRLRRSLLVRQKISPKLSWRGSSGTTLGDIPGDPTAEHPARQPRPASLRPGETCPTDNGLGVTR